MATLDVAEKQPYIHRLTRLGAATQLEGLSLADAKQGVDPPQLMLTAHRGSRTKTNEQTTRQRHGP
jgi:hypothetical protein